MLNFVSSASSKIFLTAILAVLAAGWISESLREFGLYDVHPILMLFAAFILIVGVHLGGR